LGFQFCVLVAGVRGQELCLVVEHAHNMLVAAMLLRKMCLIFFAPAACLGTAALLDFKGRLYRE